MASRLNNDQSTQGPSGPTDLTNTHSIDPTHTDPSHEDLTCTTPDSEATDAEDWQAAPSSSTQQPPFRAFRINTPQELELLTALEIHRPFTAEYGNKEAAWERVYQYLKTQDEKRESKLYETLKPETCKRRWKTMRKMCEESKKYLSRASGTSPLPSREMDKIQSLCDEEEVGKAQTEQARLSRKNKKDQTQQNHVNGTWLRDKALQHQPMKRMRIDMSSHTESSTSSNAVAPSLFHVEESTFLPSEISTSSHAGSSTPSSTGSHNLTPSTALSPLPLSVGPDITMRTSLIDLQSLIDRSDQDSIMLREQRMAFCDMKDIFMRDISERKKERAEQKESERERMDTAQRQHNDLMSCIKEQQTAMARQQEILLAIVNSIKEK
ncbi:hypothetical protein BGZ79_001494 [Entomortierella chlamydospora]|nr:hypothetical protein BGZ79_001494 [Entomortierella chlamydospora]